MVEEEILEKIAKQVQPIMHKHKWRVNLLSEFCPNNPALLGLNVGAGIHVKLRLRRSNWDWDFYPFDQVLDTMLHELCHNAHGPHNASFYKLWDELRKECKELMSKGITGTGEGFDLLRRRLGGFSRQPPLSSLRQTALAAAENRDAWGLCHLLDLNVLVVIAPLGMHLVLYKQLQWLLKGDCRMISGVVPIALTLLGMKKAVLILCRIIWTWIREERD
ncbi:hypothetical protein CXB51_015059 [Gossypium anomalum]|uniref:WLM domain-containing protein n=1 Tax=Gossypium anomalum TaxID=47600 RepID=A0A8J6D0W5_9ROSI|nr:hypothetical protein CXB51_015059 [Gossypium anomalum]